MSIERLPFRSWFRRYSWSTAPDADGMSWAGWAKTRWGARRLVRKYENSR